MTSNSQAAHAAGVRKDAGGGVLNQGQSLAVRQYFVLLYVVLRGGAMSVQLHHVALVSTDPERSAEFYQSVFMLERLERPPFNIEGVWLGCGPSLQLHLTKHPSGNFRTRGVDNNDVHFAFRTDDFEVILGRLMAMGFREDAPEDDPKRLLVNRSGLAGFLQLYVIDPDRNVIEVNTAA